MANEDSCLGIIITTHEMGKVLVRVHCKTESLPRILLTLSRSLLNGGDCEDVMQKYPEAAGNLRILQRFLVECRVIPGSVGEVYRDHHLGYTLSFFAALRQ